MASTVAILFSPDDDPLPSDLRDWLASLGVPAVICADPDEVIGLALRGRPTVAVLDARNSPETALGLLRRLKGDSFTGVVPCAALVGGEPGGPDFLRAFDAGADEVLLEQSARQEVAARMRAMLRRSERDLVVHPSTRLPATIQIEAEFTRRIVAGDRFAAGYADIDHFKEFNDRYSFREGDRVIRVLSRILHDLVKGRCGSAGFVGHIGGDDFIFVVPVEGVAELCAEIIDVFDTIIPYQYSDQDRQAGYFFGKDRRGHLHRVSLMTVSIGVVTNERRRFTHAAQVSGLAAEMKTYAKTLPGSVYAIDRRQDALPVESEEDREPVRAGTSREGM